MLSFFLCIGTNNRQTETDTTIIFIQMYIF